MNQYKEFEGKSLDDAIREACAYYGVAREKLEIEILNDAKTGIFGLVGAKKAIVRAARVHLGEAVSAIMETDGAPAPAAKSPSGRPSGNGKDKSRAGKEETAGDKGAPRGEKQAATPRRGEKKAADEQRSAAPRKALKSPGQSSSRFRSATGKSSLDAPSVKDGPDAGLSRDELPEFDLASADKDALFKHVGNVILRLVEPIVGPVPCRVEISGKRVRAILDCGDASGLLVGRDGQTLASIQYLACRILARELGASLRLHVDAGSYRERQDDKLRDLARSLAARARESGRAQSTRPLTAYQRRIVHLALEEDGDMVTRSKGEGTQRRVVISLKRHDADPAQEEDGNPSPEAVDGDSPDGFGPSGADGERE
ncbi:MAG: Jag N-terminal domain-containing protein [Desulfovibrio sp.]|jgi:spoIIIJ-associated protein|nr:Jag N-terminal domain-containing protein [Desulfovibrio sp.]